MLQNGKYRHDTPLSGAWLALAMLIALPAGLSLLFSLVMMLALTIPGIGNHMSYLLILGYIALAGGYGVPTALGIVLSFTRPKVGGWLVVAGALGAMVGFGVLSYQIATQPNYSSLNLPESLALFIPTAFQLALGVHLVAKGGSERRKVVGQ